MNIPPWKLIRASLVESMLTLFHLRVGTLCPDDQKWSAISIGLGLGSPKFMTLFLSMFDRSQQSHFLDFFWIFRKVEHRKFQGVLEHVTKIWKFLKNIFLLQKFFLFWLKLNCRCSQLYFEVYISSVAQNFQFWLFLAWKFSILTFVIWQPIVA